MHHKFIIQIYYIQKEMLLRWLVFPPAYIYKTRWKHECLGYKDGGNMRWVILAPKFKKKKIIIEVKIEKEI